MRCHITEAERNIAFDRLGGSTSSRSSRSMLPAVPVCPGQYGVATVLCVRDSTVRGPRGNSGTVDQFETDDFRFDSAAKLY